MNIGGILDQAKLARSLETDMALAEALGVNRSTVSSWRHGTRLPDPVQCATLAGLTGIPLAQVLGIVGEARAISREEKAVWRKLAASAAMLLLVVGAMPLPGRATQAPHSVDLAPYRAGSEPGIGIMRNYPAIRGCLRSGPSAAQFLMSRPRVAFDDSVSLSP